MSCWLLTNLWDGLLEALRLRSFWFNQKYHCNLVHGLGFSTGLGPAKRRTQDVLKCVFCFIIWNPGLCWIRVFWFFLEFCWNGEDGLSFLCWTSDNLHFFCVDLLVGGEILKNALKLQYSLEFFHFCFFKNFCFFIYLFILPYDCLAFFSESVHVLSVKPLHFYFTFYYLTFTIPCRTLRTFS